MKKYIFTLFLLLIFVLVFPKTGNNIEKITRRDSKYSDIIESASEIHGVPKALIKAVAHAESNFNASAKSPTGATGIMQITGSTARHLGVKNRTCPIQSIHGGAKYLSELLDTFNGNMKLAVAAYNAGPGAVRRYKGVPPYRETKHYVKKVMNLYAYYDKGGK